MRRYELLTMIKTFGKDFEWREMISVEWI